MKFPAIKLYGSDVKVGKKYLMSETVINPETKLMDAIQTMENIKAMIPDATVMFGIVNREIDCPICGKYPWDCVC